MNTITITNEENYAIVQLDRGMANAINVEMLNELHEAFEDLKNNDAIKGVILTGKKGFYSAGLDVIELYAMGKQEISDFWKNFSDLITRLASFPKPLIASITGHSPAGGCIFAICSDYRVMAEGKFKIGLNEVPVGIAVPPNIFELYAFWIGQHNAYQNLLEGKLIAPEKALEIGLVDEVVKEEEVLDKAKEKLKLYLSFGEDTWKISKRNLRKKLLKSMEIDFETDFKPTIDQWWSKDTQNRLKHIVASLTKK